jgi:hypothetical protein
MADILSRRWDLSNVQILALFDSIYPQVQPWQLFSLATRDEFQRDASLVEDTM